jgi:hypothetical protein
MKTVSAGTILKCLLIFSILPLNSSCIPGRTSKTVVVQGGEDTVINLANEASLFIPAGDVNAGSSLTFKVMQNSEIENNVPEGLAIGEIYEVVSQDWNSDLSATIVLPLDAKNMAEDEIDRYSLVYYEGGSMDPDPIEHRPGEWPDLWNNQSFFSIFLDKAVIQSYAGRGC